MKTTVFYLINRGGHQWIFHFFLLNLGGLYYILNKNYNYGNTSLINEEITDLVKSKIVDYPTTTIEYPIKIYIKNIAPFHKETFEIIKNKFELVEDLNTLTEYEIVPIYGMGDMRESSDICHFIHNLFLDYINYPIIPKKRIYITRRLSENYHYGVLKRFILNESEIMEKLKKYNFEFIQLEDYNIREKIKLFMESEVILSTNSGALSFLLFCNKNTKIIEVLNKGTYGFSHDHYKEMCSFLNIPYYRYSNIQEDMNGNFNLDFNQFEPFLVPLLS